MDSTETTYEISDWYKLYREGWQGEIIPHAMSHPAKFSRALIRNIYRHALSEGWLKEGDTVLDCFGGVGLGALDAMFLGINWIGIELEPRFVDLGGDARYCPGFSKKDWKRYHSRAGRINHKTIGQHVFKWCPDCLEALTETPKKEYVKARMASQEIPWRDDHVWLGNIGLWNERYGKKLSRWGKGFLLQGDSRKLLDRVHEANLTVSSPPYADISQSGGTKGLIEHGTGLTRGERAFTEYGETPGNLGRLKSTDELFDASVSSPPFLAQSGGTNVTSKEGPLSDGRLLKRHSAGNAAAEGYGDDPANLGNMPHGELDASISSPPFKGQSADGGWQMLGKYADQGKLTVKQVGGDPNKSYPSWNKDRDTSYGHTEGQLADMPDGELDATISSPPYAESLHPGEDKEQELERLRRRGLDSAIGKRSRGGKFQGDDNRGYSEHPENLGNLKAGDLDATISSPPYAETLQTGHSAPREGDRQHRINIGRNPDSPGSFNLHDYGETPGQLGALKNDGLEAAISSPPYAETRIDGNGDEGASGLRNEDGSFVRGSEGWQKRKEMGARYGNTEGNLGNLRSNVSELPLAAEPEDFWSAAKLIVEQTYQALKPGGHAIWVTKRFIKNGQIVDFSDQWRRLCESVGFVTTHWHRAWLVEEKGTQLDMFGNAITKTVERKSFFRRLAESKGSPRIDWEDVLCMVKPEVQDGR